jgi:hypothetical protein
VDSVGRKADQKPTGQLNELNLSTYCYARRSHIRV